MIPATVGITADSILNGLWRASWQACLLAVVVLVIQSLLGGRLGGRGRYILWSVVVLRLLLPILPQSPLSIHNLWSFKSAPVQDAHPMERAQDPDSQVTVPSFTTATDPVRAEPLPVRSEARWTWSQLILAAWMSGITAIALRLAAASVSWRKSLGRLGPVTDPHVLAIVDSSAGSLSMRRHPAILAGDQIRTPAVVGLLRPALLLPLRVLDECSAAELRLIVLHELAHVKRRDIAANWLLAAASILHWFNPFVWLIAARIRADRELACDETVLAHCPAADSLAYGQTLLRLIEILSPTSADRYPQLVGILEPSGPMQRRMRMIARYTPQSSHRWVWVSLILLALGCTALTDSVRGQARPASPASPPATRPARAAEDDAALQAQLRKITPETRFEAVELTKVIDFLRDVSGANIFVNWRALETAGIDRKSPVTLQMRDVPFERVIRHVLREVGGGAVRLDYVVEGNVLTITTEEDAASETKTVFYDVSDLLVTKEGKADAGSDAYKRLVDDLVQLIQDTLARESWRDNGGNVGSIRSFNGKLIITQTPKNHQQIDQLLVRLREGPTTQPRPLAGSY